MTVQSVTLTEQGLFAGVQMGIISIDEAREAFGFEPLPVALTTAPAVLDADGTQFTGLSLV